MQMRWDIDSDATFSECGQYRYTLWRRWGDGPSIVWLMLNPSTADALTNDATVDRCERRAIEMGYEELRIANLFAYRSTDRSVLATVEDPVGPDNDHAIRELVCDADRVVCAWGADGVLHDRAAQVLKLLKHCGVTPYCLRLTSKGQPWHPLYVGYDQKPFPYPLSAS